MIGQGSIRSAEVEFYSWVGAGFYLSFLTTEVIAPWLFRDLIPAYTKLNRAAYLEWNARWTSTVHAVFISICCICALIFVPHLWNDRLFSTDYFSEIVVCMSIGYMIYDLITMPMYMSGFALFTYIVHHGVAIAGNTINVTQGFGKFYVHYKLLTELSTPFINIRWFLRQSGLPSNHISVSLSTLCFGLTFALVRLVASIPFWFMYHESVATLDTQVKRDLVSSMSIYVYLFGITLDVLNVIWFAFIALLCLRAIRDLQSYLKKRQSGNKPIDQTTWQVVARNGKIPNGRVKSNEQMTYKEHPTSNGHITSIGAEVALTVS